MGWGLSAGMSCAVGCEVGVYGKGPCRRSAKCVD